MDLVELSMLIQEYEATDSTKEPIKKCTLYIQILKLGGFNNGEEK